MANVVNRPALSGPQLPTPVYNSLAEPADGGPTLSDSTIQAPVLSSSPPSNPSPYSPLPNDQNSLPALRVSAQPPAFPVPPNTQPLLAKPIAVAVNVSQRMSSEETLTRNVRIAVYVHLGLSMLMLVLSVVDLCLHKWVEYCGTRISLSAAYPSGDSLKDFKNQYCSAAEVNAQCGDICGNLKRLMLAGQVMGSFGGFALVLSFLAVLGIGYLRWGTQHHWCRVLLRILYPFAATCWLVGTMVYVGLYIYIHDDTSDSSTGFGLQLAISLMMVQIIICVLGNIVVTYLCAQGPPTRTQSRT